MLTVRLICVMPWVYPKHPLSHSSKNDVHHLHFTNKDTVWCYVISMEALKIVNDRVKLYPRICHSRVGTGFEEQT